MFLFIKFCSQELMIRNLDERISDAIKRTTAWNYDILKSRSLYFGTRVSFFLCEYVFIQKVAFHITTSDYKLSELPTRDQKLSELLARDQTAKLDTYQRPDGQVSYLPETRRPS